MAKRPAVRRPERPPASQPNLRRAWDRLFARPNTTLISVQARRRRHAVVPQSRLVQVASATTRVLSSPNWSGGLIVPHGGEQIVLLFGEWTVPEPKVPPLADQQVNAGQYGCSTWIGLDGDRRYVNSSLPQIGTEQWLAAPGGPASYDAFFQWWSRYEQAPTIYKLGGLTITKHATITAMLWVVDAFTVSAAMGVADGSGNMQLFEQEFFAPQIVLGQVNAQPAVSGATAEWVVERPMHTQQLIAFPDYGRVDFKLCVAGTGPAAGVLTGEEVLHAPRLLRLFEVPPNAPSRTRMISHAKRTGDTSLAVHYGPIP